MDVVLVRMKTLISLHIFIRALGCPGALSMSSNILKRTFFFWAVGLNSGLTIFSKPCCKQIGSHLGFVVPFIEHVHTQLLQSWLFVTPWTVCSPPGSSAHGILQARILEWVAMPFSRGSSRPKNWTLVSCVSCIEGRFFTTELLGKTSFIEHRQNQFIDS